jgi:hypothetical protein
MAGLKVEHEAEGAPNGHEAGGRHAQYRPGTGSPSASLRRLWGPARHRKRASLATATSPTATTGTPDVRGRGEVRPARDQLRFRRAGRTGPELIQLQKWIHQRHGQSRRALSVGLAKLWDWRDHHGHLRDIASRLPLNRLEQRLGLRLPARQSRGGRRQARRRPPSHGFWSAHTCNTGTGQPPRGPNGPLPASETRERARVVSRRRTRCRTYTGPVPPRLPGRFPPPPFA